MMVMPIMTIMIMTIVVALLTIITGSHFVVIATRLDSQETFFLFVEQIGDTDGNLPNSPITLQI